VSGSQIMSLTLNEDFGTLINRTNFATPFISAIATTLQNGLSLTSAPVTSIACMQLYGSNGRTGNVVDGQTQVNFVLLNTGLNVPSAVTYLLSAFIPLNNALAAAQLPSLVPNSVQVVTTPPPSSSSSGLDSGAIAGIVIGGTVALFFIICAFLYVCCYRSSMNKSKHTSAGDVEEQQSRVDKHSSLDEQAEAEAASEVEMHSVGEVEETAV